MIQTNSNSSLHRSFILTVGGPFHPVEAFQPDRCSLQNRGVPGRHRIRAPAPKQGQFGQLQTDPGRTRHPPGRPGFTGETRRIIVAFDRFQGLGDPADEAG